MQRHTIIQVITAIFILLFVYTALSKLQSLERFQGVLGKSEMLAPFASSIAIGLPVVELLVAALLFIPRSRLIGLYATGFLMAMFTGYILYMMVFSPALPCTCGGVLRQLTWEQHLAFNVGLLILSGIGLSQEIINRNLICVASFRRDGDRRRTGATENL